MKYIQASCAKCHSAADLPQASVLARGRAVFEEQGCIGCHKLGGFGSNIGPELVSASALGPLYGARWLIEILFKQLKSSYRPEYLDRLQEKDGIEGSRARQATTDREVESLIARGFLSRNKAGSVAITTEGRNAADPRQP